MTATNQPSGYRGQCLCGSIRYEVDEIGPQIAHCHCSMCRKFHGAAFATIASARASDFRWLAGEELLETYRAANGTRRKFCRRCGSSLIFAPSGDTGEIVEFALGTLDTPTDARPTGHIFVAHGADWYPVCDKLPRYRDGRNSERID